MKYRWISPLKGCCQAWFAFTDKAYDGALMGTELLTFEEIGQIMGGN